MNMHMKKPGWSAVLLAVCVVLLSACAQAPRPAKVEYKTQPPSNKIDYHIVARGDTLFLIAWNYGIDYRELARINGLSSPYKINLGQRLDLHGGKPPKGVAVFTTAAAAPVTTTTVKSAPVTPRNGRAVDKPIKPTTSVPPIKSSSTAAPLTAVPVSTTPQVGATTTTASLSKELAAEAEADNAAVTAGVVPPVAAAAGTAVAWQWPAKGKMIGGYSADGKMNKGVDIAGSAGDPVLASAAGKVVYAGSGLLGYGQLIILKHNDEFLSAYAHNRTLLVSEGQSVNSGQKIAEIGSSGTTENKLHFEIRQSGKPVNPLNFLPPR